jgi:hypothetical protein
MPFTTFTPARHGFHFSNNDIDWSIFFLKGKNLCGGMIYAAMDFYLNGMTIPADTRAPPEGSPLQAYILGRQEIAHANTVPTFLSQWFAANTGSVFSASMGPRYDELVSLLRKGTPVVLCLVGDFKGHHVLAIDCSATKPPLIKLYDPNFPDRVTVMKPGLGGPAFVETPGGQWHGFFIDSGYRKQAPPLLGGQANWRWCHKCEGMFFNGDATNGVCPAGGVHAIVGSGNYVLPFGAGNGQPDWKRCFTCRGLYFSGHPGSAGRCPSGGVHNGFGSANYILAQNSDAGQPDWRWCKKCEGMFFGGRVTKGRCPAGGGHDASASGNYVIPFG